MIYPEGTWTEADDVAARDIFKTSTWQKMIAIMKLNRPKVSNNPSDSVVAREAIGAQKWDDCIDMFANFANLSAAESIEDELEQPDMSKPLSSKRFERVI
jgi:hypothetical protein